MVTWFKSYLSINEDRERRENLMKRIFQNTVDYFWQTSMVKGFLRPHLRGNLFLIKGKQLAENPGWAQTTIDFLACLNSSDNWKNVLKAKRVHTPRLKLLCISPNCIKYLLLSICLGEQNCSPLHFYKTQLPVRL